MESTHPFSVSFAPCFQAVLCRSQLFFRMFLDKLFQICADRFIMKQKRRCFSPFLLSPSSRRAWIEISSQANNARRKKSPSSRRAWIEICCLCAQPLDLVVALLAEGVDRNVKEIGVFAKDTESPSSRRAWIEISKSLGGRTCDAVALLTEGVDRNSAPRTQAPA